MDHLESSQDQPPTADTGLSRKKLLGLGVAGLGAVSAATPLSAAAGSRVSTAASAGPIASLVGPKRTIVWAIAAIAPWNEDLDVGFADAARLLGWEYKKIGLPISDYSAENHVNTIRRATLTKPDVLVTCWWVKGVAAAMADAQKKGIMGMACQADDYKDDRVRLGIPYVGSEGFANGKTLGVRIGQELSARGKKTGVVIFGNPFPGNGIIETRRMGVEAGLKEWNKGHGTSFKVENFPDKADTDQALSSSLYSAKITQLKKNLVGVAQLTAAGPSIVSDALNRAGYKKGEIVLGCLGTDPETVKAIQNGWAAATVDEGKYPLGFTTAMLAWEQLQQKTAASDYLTVGAIVTKKNLNLVIQREAAIQKRSKEYGIRLS